MNKHVIFWLPAVAWAAGIFLLSAMSYPPSPGPDFPGRDKFAHWMLYLILGCLIARALRHAHGFPSPRTFILAVLICSAYGVTDEFHQRFIPHRTCDVYDWLADTLGGFAAAAVYYAYESHRSAKANC